MSRIVKVESEVPFGHSVFTWLMLHSQHIEHLARHDMIERQYLAWETVRRETNPFFQDGTGFEGYFVGRCAGADDALKAILNVGQGILDAIARYYKYQFRFRSTLMKTLTRESGDWEAVAVWSDYLGATLGRLRAQILTLYPALAFQQRTYSLVKMLPPISYAETDHDVWQTYAVAGDAGSKAGKVCVMLPLLKPCEQDAWIVAEHIGQFGHPVIRRLLDERGRFSVEY